MTGSALVDDLGRAVPLDPEPRRVLSLVPSVTECLFDLGAGERVVGRTAYCVSPADRIRRLPEVGGPKSVDAAAVGRLAPDLVLANAEENDRAQVEGLMARGYRVHVAFPRTLADAARFLDQVGALLRVSVRARRAAEELRRAAREDPGPRVPAACLIWKDPYMTASGDTLTSALLEAAGGRNVFAGSSDRYPVLTAGDLAAAGPRAVLLPSEPYPFGEADAREVAEEVPGAAAVPVPGEWLTWYGCRAAASIRLLRATLDPFRPA